MLQLKNGRATFVHTCPLISGSKLITFKGLIHSYPQDPHYFLSQIDCPISFSSYSPKTSHFHHQRPLIFISFYRFITFSIYLLHFSYDDDSCIYFSGAFKNLNASKSCILYGPYLYKYKSLYYITALKAFLISSLPS